MNIALEKTEEHVDGVKKRSYGDAFVRGNNGKFLETYCERVLLISSSHVHLSRLISRIEGHIDKVTEQGQ